MSTASIDWVTTATAVSAIASAVAAIAALVVTVLVAKLQNRWEERRKERENRKVIQTFIEDLSDACGGVWARVVFRNLDRPEDDLAGRIADTGNIQTEYLDVFKRAQDELARFDDASMPAMINMLRGVREFRSWCMRTAEQVRSGNELARHSTVREGLAHYQGRMQALTSAVGPHLVRYGAIPAAWHGLPDEDPGYDPME